MTVKELYDYITAQMTPKQALMKLLEGSVIQYEKLKFDENGEPVHPVLVITMAKWIWDGNLLSKTHKMR